MSNDTDEDKRYSSYPNLKQYVKEIDVQGPRDMKAFQRHFPEVGA